MDTHEAKRMLSDHGLTPVAMVRGGFFAATSLEKRAASINHNKYLIELSAAIGVEMLVLVCGADPGQSLSTSRAQIQGAIEALTPFAEQHKVKLAIEPLHPMYADTRSAINTLGQANDMAEAIASPWVGVAVDVYHVWWDDRLEFEISRCGRLNKLFAFHICDWRVPTEDSLNDRELMGKGCIPLRQIREWVLDTGFEGFHEVEIFSNRYWNMDQDDFLRDIVEAYGQLIN